MNHSPEARTPMWTVSLVMVASLLTSLAWAEPPSYDEALAAGRKATKDQRWSAAFKALDQALVAKPGDARALAARGYARLLSVPDAGPASEADKATLLSAEEDLTLAVESNQSEAVTKAATYNLTLVAQKRAAWSGRGGKCKATFKSGAIATPYASWSALLEHLVTKEELSLEATSAKGGDGKTTTESAAKAALCPAPCTGPVVTEVSDDDKTLLLALAPRPGGGVFAATLATEWRVYDCNPDTVVLETEPVGNGFVRARGAIAEPLLMERDAHNQPCDSEGDEECERLCYHAGKIQFDVVMNPTTGRGVLVEWPAGLPGSLSVVNGAIVVEGCAPQKLP
jgi:hypothetical protein